MTKVVVDSSAVIAYLRREPGWEAIEGYLAGTCLISTVNLTEVVGTLRDKGIGTGALDDILDQLELTVMPFDGAQARRAGDLQIHARSPGLSLGARACLALAAAQKLTAVTTDSAWRQLDVGVVVEVLG